MKFHLVLFRKELRVHGWKIIPALIFLPLFIFESFLPQGRGISFDTAIIAALTGALFGCDLFSEEKHAGVQDFLDILPVSRSTRIFTKLASNTIFLFCGLASSCLLLLLAVFTFPSVLARVDLLFGLSVGNPIEAGELISLIFFIASVSFCLSALTSIRSSSHSLAIFAGLLPGVLVSLESISGIVASHENVLLRCLAAGGIAVAAILLRKTWRRSFRYCDSLIWKDLTDLLPSAGMAALLIMGSALLFGGEAAFLFALVFTIWLGASRIGDEKEQKTFTLLMSLPQYREQILRDKVNAGFYANALIILAWFLAAYFSGETYVWLLLIKPICLAIAYYAAFVLSLFTNSTLKTSIALLGTAAVFWILSAFTLFFVIAVGTIIVSAIFWSQFDATDHAWIRPVESSTTGRPWKRIAPFVVLLLAVPTVAAGASWYRLVQPETRVVAPSRWVSEISGQFVEFVGTYSLEISRDTDVLHLKLDPSTLALKRTMTTSLPVRKPAPSAINEIERRKAGQKFRARMEPWVFEVSEDAPTVQADHWREGALRWEGGILGRTATLFASSSALGYFGAPPVAIAGYFRSVPESKLAYRGAPDFVVPFPAGNRWRQPNAVMGMAVDEATGIVFLVGDAGLLIVEMTTAVTGHDEAPTIIYLDGGEIAIDEGESAWPYEVPRFVGYDSGRE